MKTSRKWVTTSFMLALCVSLLTGCPDNSDNKIAPDQAVKDAYIQSWSESYNYAGAMSIEITPDDKAIIGTQGGLSEEDAQDELNLIMMLNSPEGKQIVSTLQNTKFTFHGASDVKNMKFDVIAGADFELNGAKINLELPLLIDLKEEPTVYIDPKAGAMFGFIPPQLKGKLIKVSLADFPNLTAEQKEKFNKNNPLLQELRGILVNYINDLDPTLFKDIDVSEPAKKAGATRTIQLKLSPKQNSKMSENMTNKLLDVMGDEFGLTLEETLQIKQSIVESNKSSEMFMGDAITEYSLNNQGQMVYFTSEQGLKGAKHIGTIKIAMTVKDYANPKFTVNPDKQSVISITEVMGDDITPLLNSIN